MIPTAQWVCTFALLLALPAHAQEAPRPAVAIGDRWQFAVYYTQPSTVPNRTWVVTALDGEQVRGTENGEPLTLTRELNVLDAPGHAESNPRALSFPLHVGKRWRYDSEWLFKTKMSRGTLAVEVAVLSYESVETPAGKFGAFKLHAIGTLGGSSPSSTFYGGQTTTTYWYAPSARAIVKSVHHNPYLGTTHVDLVAYELQ